MNIGSVLEKSTYKNPDKTYLYYRDEKISYSDFNERVNRVANGFLDLGIREGDRVCIMVRNCPEFLYAWLGLSKIGGILVPINAAFKEKEVEYIARHSEACAIVAAHPFAPIIEAVKSKTPQLQRFIGTGEGEAPGWIPFKDLLQAPGELKTSAKQTEDHVSTIMYTSGTTGPPKGVLVPHKAYTYCGQGFSRWIDIKTSDRLFTCLPLYHANAQYYSTMGSLAAGASLILVDGFSASRFWDQIREYGATEFNFIGMMLLVLTKQPESERDRDNSIRVAYGTPALEKSVQDYVEKRYGLTILCGYALTESPFGTIQPLYGLRKEKSIGQPRQHPTFKNEVKIFDENDREVPHGTIGELVIKNTATMKGYYKEPELTEKVLKGGWLHTGDNAYQDRDGYFYFVDRKKDFIRRRGENISSMEVESVMNAYPKALESAAIGVQSELLDEEVYAYVVPKSGETIDPADLFLWCKERLAYFKIPRYIEFRDSLPKTPTHRIEKYKLRSENKDLTERCFDREKMGIEIK
jgi:crotonobetaine/carnitine-CoA ligase